MKHFGAMDRRQFIGMGAAALGAWGTLASVGRTAAPVPAPDGAGFTEMTPAAEKAIEKGLEWLNKIQNAKGGYWGCEAGAQPSAAITGMAALALLATGSTPMAGRYTEPINRAIDWALRSQRGDGLISMGQDVTGIGPFFEHAAVSMFLTEAYGMNHAGPENDRMRRGVQAAIHYLDTQQNRDGGWSESARGAASDLAVTASVYASLRSGHNSGLDVQQANLEKLVQFTEQRGDKNGGFRGNHGFFYPTSAGLRIMYSQGRQAEPQVVKSAERLVKHVIASEYGGSISEWDYLATYYATHAFLLDSGGPMWKAWFPKTREYLIKKQNPDGSWSVEYCMKCRAFATAVALLVLQAPLRTLPMWQL
jgi:squalene cyclase